jgi:hypothetical protein
MYLGNNSRRTGALQDGAYSIYHPMILPSDSVEVGRQQHIDNLLNSRYNIPSEEDWVDRERVERIKKEIK